MSRTDIKPTESELEILNILWSRGSSSVRDVHDELTKTKEIGYTTTLKLMQIMNEKGLLSRDESNRSHIYTADITKEDTQGDLLKRMIDSVFGGNAAQLVLQALGNHKTSQKELDQIKAYLNSMEKGNK